MNRNVLLSILFISFGLLSAQWLWPSENGMQFSPQFSEKVNLALRQVGHQLLKMHGDSTSTIYPVREKSETEFVLQLQSAFNYEALPPLMYQALNDFGINSVYHVAVRECDSDTLLLGYHLISYQNNEVACSGREQFASCNNIYLTFEKEEKENQMTSRSIPLLLGSSGLLFLVWNFISKNKKEEKNTPSKTENKDFIEIGQTVFDHKNQTVKFDGEIRSLTFRENKLLHFLATQPNQVLEREKILSEVWGDEGVIVGRSLDVFISRLRKILKADERLQIKNVHGVGYRLEVAG